MSRPIYIPIADSFFESSIMREEIPVRFVMLALIRLALRAGANGNVDVDPKIFAMSINVPFPTVEAAIRRLMEPDPASSSPDEDGRRIVPVDPERPFRNWRLVNWTRYRHIVHLANDAARKRDDRHNKKDIMDASENVQKRPQPSRNGATNTKYEIRNTKNEERERASTFVAPTAEEVSAYAKEKGLTLDAAYFVDFFEAKGWMTGKVRMKSWRAAARNASRDGWTIRQGTNSFTPAPNPTQNHEAASNDRQAEVARELAEERRLRKEMGR